MTLNNYTEEQLNRCFEQLPETRYQITGEEVGETGTPHLQGYFYFDKKRTLKQAIALFKEYGFGNPHIEIARGKPAENQKYCSKENNFIEHGVLPLEQSRAGGIANADRWDQARIAAREGRFSDIPTDIYVKYDQAWHREYMREKAKKVPAIVPFDFYWIQGRPNSGKSSYARHTWKNIYEKSLNKWWQAYEYQEVVLLDEVDPSHTSWISSFLKRWCDHYAFPAEVKNGQTTARPKTVLITTNYSIEELWPNDKALQEALIRRFINIRIDHNNPWRWNNPEDVSMITQTSKEDMHRKWLENNAPNRQQEHVSADNY